MSGLRSKIASAVTSSPTTSPRNSVDQDRPETPKKKDDPDRYRLLVTAGPSYDVSTHKIVHVNTSTPTFIENEFIRAKVKVRIRGYHGLPSTSPDTSPYFSDPMHAKDQYSVAFDFIPKQDLPSTDMVWGNDFDHPVRDRLPPGVNTAFKIVKDWVDPGLEMDAYADQPWLLGPALSCWFAFRIGDKTTNGDEMPERREEEDVMHEGADGEGKDVRSKLHLPDNNEKRRKHFLTRSNREAFNFEKDRMYGADFYNPYLDFGNFALKLPGFSIKVIKYIDDKSHTLRYVFKNRTTGDVYLCVNLNLLWGEQLEKALKEDEGMLEGFAGAEFNGDQAEGTQSSNDKTDPADRREDANDVDTRNASRGEDVSSKPQPKTAPETPVASQASSDLDGSSEGPKLQDWLAGQRKSTHQHTSAENLEESPGMRDKPDHVRQQVQNMSIADLLQQTASRQKRDTGSGGLLEDDVD